MSRYIPIGDEQLFLGGLPDDETIIDTNDALTINLIADDDRKLVVRFHHYLAYRKMDEGDAIRMLRDYADSGHTGRLLYRVEQSDFLQWFENENESVRNIDGVQHFCVATMNSIIDVIALESRS